MQFEESRNYSTCFELNENHWRQKLSETRGTPKPHCPSTKCARICTLNWWNWDKIHQHPRKCRTTQYASMVMLKSTPIWTRKPTVKPWGLVQTPVRNLWTTSQSNNVSISREPPETSGIAQNWSGEGQGDREETYLRQQILFRDLCLLCLLSQHLHRSRTTTLRAQTCLQAKDAKHLQTISPGLHCTRSGRVCMGRGSVAGGW